MSTKADQAWIRPRFPVPDLSAHGVASDDFHEGLNRLSRFERNQFWQNLLRLGFEVVSDHGIGGGNLVQFAELIERAFPGQTGEALKAQMRAISASVAPGFGVAVQQPSKSPAGACVGSIPKQEAGAGGIDQSGAPDQVSPESVTQSPDGAAHHQSSTTAPSMEGGAVQGRTDSAPSSSPASGSDSGKAASAFASLFVE